MSVVGNVSQKRACVCQCSFSTFDKKSNHLIFDKEISFDLIGVVFFLRPITMSHVIPERVITGTVSVNAIQTIHDHYTMRLLIN